MNKSQQHKQYVKRILTPIYNDPKTGFRGRNKLFKYIQTLELEFPISRRDVAYFLSNIESYQLHLIRPRDLFIFNDYSEKS